MMIEKATLAETADKALERAKGALPVASRMLLSTVMTNADLLAELLGVSRDEVRERVDEFLRGRASHLRDGRQVRVDRSAPAPFDSSRPSRLGSESRIAPDRPAAPSMREGGASLRSSESHSTYDRPARSAPARKIGTAAALSVARSVFDFQVGVNVKLGDLTLDDVVNAERKVFFAAHLTRTLRERVQWPDRHTPLRQFCSPDVAEAIWKDATKALEELPLPAEVADAR